MDLLSIDCGSGDQMPSISFAPKSQGFQRQPRPKLFKIKRSQKLPSEGPQSNNYLSELLILQNNSLASGDSGKNDLILPENVRRELERLKSQSDTGKLKNLDQWIKEMIEEQL
jgi:hypothetical protein